MPGREPQDPENPQTGFWSGGWGWGAGLVVFLEAGLDGSFPDAEPFGHAVHGDPAGAGCGEGRVYLGGGLGAGLFRTLVVVPGLADELVEVGVVWGLLAGGHGAAGVGLVPDGTGRPVPQLDTP